MREMRIVLKTSIRLISSRCLNMNKSALNSIALWARPGCGTVLGGGNLSWLRPSIEVKYLIV